MIQRKLSLSTPSDFGFWRTVLSHGWYGLPPFYLDREHRLLRRVLGTSGSPALVEMCEADQHQVHLTVHSSSRLSQRDVKCIKAQVAHILRLDESLQDFHLALAKASDNGEFDWIPKVRAGRLLRSPSIFEDIVKMICTTNCAWSATERMVENLVMKLGTRLNHQYSNFPTPQQLAASSERFLSEEIRTGYRGPYLLELADKVATGSLDFTRWQELKEEELYKEMVTIKGVGPYAAGNLLRLLGHYQHLALDSWCRPKYSEIYRQGRKVSDRTIGRHYKRYGRWSGLVMWLDLTRDWFDDAKRPF